MSVALALVALPACSRVDDTPGDGGGDERARAEASITFEGDLGVVLRFEALRGRPVLARPPGGMSITWGDARGNLFGIGGAAFTGSRRTDPTFIATLNVVEGDRLVAFLSADGECRVTVREVRLTGISGRIRCRNLVAEDRETSVDVRGTFSASAPRI